MIHTVKGFSVINEAGLDDFFEFPCFFLWSNRCWQFDLWFLCLFLIQGDSSRKAKPYNMRPLQAEGFLPLVAEDKVRDSESMNGIWHKGSSCQPWKRRLGDSHGAREQPLGAEGSPGWQSVRRRDLSVITANKFCQQPEDSCPESSPASTLRPWVENSATLTKIWLKRAVS